ncbi:hypothetical protein IFM89_006638 [Coptis chinensis]|uniref:Uncharacterized protein n=1 Tax=Coptis chinensis TaxID=261450 RepID=A0A835LMF1_9MAGN|nr:hypothetical protein IFM89_006638 [Coptis chinensis]
MIDCDIVGGNWIEVPVGKYKKAVRTMSYCQLEFDCLYPYAPEVANLVTLQGESQPFVRNIMTLKSYSPIVGADVMPFENEREVLLAWRIGEAIKVNEKCPDALSMLGASELKNDDWLKAKETFRAARKATDGKDSYYALSLVGTVYGKETGTTLLPPVQDCLENRIEICNP